MHRSSWLMFRPVCRDGRSNQNRLRAVEGECHIWPLATSDLPAEAALDITVPTEISRRRRASERNGLAFVDVRLAMIGDIDVIRDIDSKAGRAPADVDAIAAAIVDEARLVVVASVGGTIVGWGKTHFWSYADGQAPGGHYLGGVTVIPELRRHGIARALTQARLDWIWGRADSAWYIVNPSNRASIDLHRQWGFAEVARAAKFHTTSFTGGVGLLLQAKQPTED
jgi:aminoglycoside 6'-N-acetyltransferase I